MGFRGQNWPRFAGTEQNPPRQGRQPGAYGFAGHHPIKTFTSCFSHWWRNLAFTRSCQSPKLRFQRSAVSWQKSHSHTQSRKEASHCSDPGSQAWRWEKTCRIVFTTSEASKRTNRRLGCSTSFRLATTLALLRCLYEFACSQNLERRHTLL